MDLFVEGMGEVKHGFPGVSKLQRPLIHWLTTSIPHLAAPNFETSQSGVPTKWTVWKCAGKLACLKLDSNMYALMCCE